MKKKTKCSIETLRVSDNLVLRNFESDLEIHSNSYKQAASFELDIAEMSKDEKMKDYKNIFPKKVTCATDSALKKIILLNEGYCEFETDAYYIKLGGKIDVETKEFGGRHVWEAYGLIEEDLETISMLSKVSANDNIELERILKKYRIDLKEIVAEVKSKKLADEILKIIRLDDPDYKKEQYVATINMGISMLAVVLSGVDGISQSTSDQIVSVANAFGKVLTSEKEYAQVVLRHKNDALLGFSDFVNLMKEFDTKPLSLLKLLSDYDVNVKSK